MARLIEDADAPPASLLVRDGSAARQVLAESVELLPHQAAVVSQFSGVVSRFIGDEMRVGKTPSAIALDQQDRSNTKRKQRGNNCTLIVCPKTVLTVWPVWLERMGIPFEDIFVEDGETGKPKLTAMLHEIGTQKAAADATARYIVVNKFTVKSHGRALLKAGPWFHIIGDEIHFIKDYNSERTKAFKRIKSKYKTALSGTPADNAPEDMWSALNWLNSRKYSSYWDFCRRVCTVSVNHKTGYEYIDGVNFAALPEFHKEIEPFYVRRRLSEVAEYLPTVQRETIYVEMGKRQRKEYDKLKASQYLDLEVASDGSIETILTPTTIEWLTRAQQLAIGVCKWNAKGNPEVTDAPKSPKITWIEDWLNDNPDEPLVVFCQHRATASRIRERLSGKWPSVAVSGASSVADRSNAIESFQHGRARVFIGTIKSCCEGIDLSRADTLVFIDKWWNPSYNEQAEFRIQNLGSTDGKTIITLEARNSVDQYRNKRISTKAENTYAMVNPA